MIESPGSTVGATTIENSLGFIAECINRAHKATKTVKLVLENMVRPCHRSSFEICTYWLLTQAGAGNVIGSRFSDLAGIIAKVDDKTRIGVCLDTCKPNLFSPISGT